MHTGGERERAYKMHIIAYATNGVWYYSSVPAVNATVSFVRDARERAGARALTR